jgi:Ca2+-binding EF-hand superfamily protein
LSNNTEWITFEQFKQFMQKKTNIYKNPLVIIELKQVFNEVDTNNDGFISPEEARQGITLAGQRTSGLSFEGLMKTFDDNHDGQISLEEFLDNVQKVAQA